jgi:hypothetical protein
MRRYIALRSAFFPLILSVIPHRSMCVLDTSKVLLEMLMISCLLLKICSRREHLMHDASYGVILRH